MKGAAMTATEFDLLIVGAGPTGLYAAYYAGLRGLRTALSDSLPDVGGQVTALYPEKPIYDVAGFPAVRGRNLVDRLAEQADQFRPAYLLGDPAVALHRRGDGRVQVVTDSGAVIRCRAVLICGGRGRFTPRPFPAGSEWLGRGLHYFVPELEAHTGQDVVVVGEGDSASDWALALVPVARSVTLVRQRAAFRADEHSVSQLTAGGVEVILDAEVTRVSGADWVDRVEITRRAGDTHARPAQAVIAALGCTADLGPIRDWGVGLVRDQYVAVDTTMATSVPGVFAAGDIADYRGKVRLISVGFGEAATAVNNAAVRINPDERLFPGHSSDAPPPFVVTAA
jgi:ferredoxin/flavodoxin---NADP+ reductase